MKKDDVKRFPMTDTTLESLEPEAQEYALHDGNGLYFRVRKNGNKDWRFRYKNELGKTAWKGLGGYPKVKGKLAREKARKLMDILANGGDINESKTPITFAELADEWLNHYQNTVKVSTFQTTLSRINNHLLPFFGKRDFKKITSKEWKDYFLEQQITTGAYEVYKRTANIADRIYDYAKFSYDNVENPVKGISAFLLSDDERNYPHVEQHEIPKLINDILNYPTTKGRYALMLLALFYCRPSELLKAKWTDFDLTENTWHIPKENTKTDRDFTRPISRQAKEILIKLQRYTGNAVYIFPNARDNSRPATLGFLEKALHRIGYKDKHTPHGFRHMASTYINEHTAIDNTKFDERIISFSLTHKTTGVKGKYNKAQYLKDRQALAQWYANQLYSMIDKGKLHKNF
ncbi:MAG: integrase arm-type DNA-binding domain-containing protein [Acinetobacter sp.]|nr:integrase arm-type DNA-binding domain-containing protein [Acinetobacter sp.]